MADCLTCENAIFDELWGEFKCKVREHRVYQPLGTKTCDHYKKGKPTESKDDNYDSCTN